MRTLDLLFICGTRAIFIVTLSILKQIEEDLLNAGTFEDTLAILTNLKEKGHIDEERVFTEVFNYKMSSKLLKMLESHYKQNPNVKIMLFENKEKHIEIKELPGRPS